MLPPAPAPPPPSYLFFLSPQNSDFLRELVVTIAREGLEDKYGLQLNPGEEQEGPEILGATLGRVEFSVSGISLTSFQER